MKWEGEVFFFLERKEVNRKGRDVEREGGGEGGYEGLL
jgi:hypothetical protein